MLTYVLCWSVSVTAAVYLVIMAVKGWQIARELRQLSKRIDAMLQRPRETNQAIEMAEYLRRRRMEALSASASATEARVNLNGIIDG